MDINALRALSDTQRVQKLYSLIDEDSRLTRSRAASVEYLTAMRLFARYLQPHSRVLDAGAGTGAYSFALAQLGHTVDALELASSNIHAFLQKDPAAAGITLRQGNALDLSVYEDESFDAVLLMGPLYHLAERTQQLRCLAEAKRVLKPNGLLFAAFIQNDMVILTEMCYDKAYLLRGSYNKQTFAVENVPFVFHTLAQCRSLVGETGFETLTEAAQDGVSELLAEHINALDEESFSQYLRYHFYCCEQPHMLGHSRHLLFVCRKGCA